MYLDNYKDKIYLLCKQNNVKSLYVFGSVITDQFTDESDVDLIVDIDANDPIEYSDYYFNLKFGIVDLINRSVDLLEQRADLKPYIRQNIDKTKELFYAKGQSI